MHRGRMSHLAAMLTVGWLIAGFGGSPAAGADDPLHQINYVIVIYQENHSFDNYFGTFPGADGIANAGATTTQVDKQGRPYRTLPQPLATPRVIGGQEEPRLPDPRFPADLPNRPFLFNQFVPPSEQTANLIHTFYRNQYQINSGKMDQFVAWTDAGGMVMGYWDLSGLPLYKLAQEYTLADRFFQAAFGGSFLNHQWLICACTPTFTDAPQELRAIPFPDDSDHLQDRAVTPDGYVVNTAFSVNHPRPSHAKADHLVPNQTSPTIGERLSAAGVSWAWYSGGWNDALAGRPHERFQFHHQPFVYFAAYADGTVAKAQHLKDEAEFLAALHTGTLPAVSFIKPIGLDNEHPGYTTVLRGQEHVAALVRAVE